MKTFKDNEGIEWAVKIDVAAVKRVRDAEIDGGPVDLLRIGNDEKLHERLSSDPVFLVDILYVICKPQATERSITDEQFGSRMGGDALDSAVEAFLTELVNFFPKTKRTPLTRAMEKAAAVQTAAMERAVKAIDAIDVQKLLDESTPGRSSTSSPASPE